MLSTQGIIIRTVKYGETSLILDVYTKEKGLISCIVSGVRKKKSGLSSLYQLMTVLNLTVYYKGGGGLNRIKEAKPVVHYKTILFDPLKRMIILFIAELVQKCLKENEGSERVFNFIHENFILFDEMEIGVSNFHLFFSMELTRYLGFYPEGNNADLPYFNFLQGTFTDVPTVDQTLNEHQSQAFSALINQPLEAIQQMKFSGQERMDLLHSFIKFYQCHVSNFGTMNSPEILHVVLST